MRKFRRFLGYHARVLPAASLSFLRFPLCPLLVLACEAREPDDRPLAQVGTELITERDYRSFVAGLPEWTRSEAEGSDQVRDYLQSLVDRALILRAAREQKVEQSAGVQRNMEVALRLKVGQAMEQRYIRPAVSVSEAELRREFAAQGWERQLKIAHIFARTQARAEAALAALRTGRAFAEVAHEFSQNRTTAAHGGEKPYYYSRINAIPAVRDSLFSLPKGAISGILPVPKGYEIFKILDERTASYEQMRPQVLKAVMRERLQARRRAYIDSLAEQFQWQEVAEGMDRLRRILHSGAQEGDKKVFYLSEADAATALYTYQGGAISLGEAVNRSQFIRQGRYVEDSLKVASYLERDVKVPQLLLTAGARLGNRPRAGNRRLAHAQKGRNPHPRNATPRHGEPEAGDRARDARSLRGTPKELPDFVHGRSRGNTGRGRGPSARIAVPDTRRPAAGRAANRPPRRNKKERARGERVTKPQRRTRGI